MPALATCIQICNRDPNKVLKETMYTSLQTLNMVMKYSEHFMTIHLIT